MENGLRTLWARHFKINWKFGFFLLLIISIPRFVLVLNANQTGNYRYIGWIMILSALVPFIFLNKYGLRQMGLTKVHKLKPVFYALISGLIISFLLFIIGWFLYGSTFENWYVYIGKSYNIPDGIAGQEKFLLFVIMAIVAMTFSPIGEEFYFRGIVQNSFAHSIGEKKASFIDSLAFALVHISHFGWVYVGGKWEFYFLPALIWALSIFLTGILFFTMKKLTGSIWGAVLCHAGFNLGMIYCIFYLM